MRTYSKTLLGAAAALALTAGTASAAVVCNETATAGVFAASRLTAPS